MATGLISTQHCGPASLTPAYRKPVGREGPDLLLLLLLPPHLPAAPCSPSPPTPPLLLQPLPYPLLLPSLWLLTVLAASISLSPLLCSCWHSRPPSTLLPSQAASGG